MDLLDKLESEWTIGSWSIGVLKGHGWSASVHGHGVCKHGYGKTPEAAFYDAVKQFRAEYPDEITAKRKQLIDAQETAARLSAELEGVA